MFSAIQNKCSQLHLIIKKKKKNRKRITASNVGAKYNNKKKWTTGIEPQERSQINMQKIIITYDYAKI